MAISDKLCKIENLVNQLLIAVSAYDVYVVLSERHHCAMNMVE